MRVIATELPGVLILEPKVFGDERGFFMEIYRRDDYARHGIPRDLVQDNLSYSRRGVLRGLHLQWPHPQGKLVQVFSGEVFDVAVDVRRGSPTFERWIGVRLSGKNKCQLWIPAGFAHSFYVTGPDALFTYKCSAFYHPETELSAGTIPTSASIGRWAADPTCLPGDLEAGLLRDVPAAKLPIYGNDKK